MRLFGLKTLITISILNFSMLNAQDVHTSIKQEISKLFQEKLLITEDELHISFNHLPNKLEKFTNNRIEVYSQKRILNPGSQSVWVRFYDGVKILKKVPVNVTVSLVKQVVVARQRINRGKGFNNNNLRLETKYLGKDWDQYFFSVNDLFGAESKRLIKKGIALTSRMVRETQMVHSGQKINVRVKSGNLSISTIGTAKESGAYGEEIKLKLEKTGKTIRGVISSENLVVVFQE